MVFYALMVLGVMIYSNTFKFSFVFDDFHAIVGNHSIHHLTDLSTIWNAFNTRFVVGLSLAFNYALGKESVVGYHLFNTLVHILNSFLVYFLVCLTFKTPRMSIDVSVDPRLLGFFSALVFLTHPIQIQAVTYIWQRTTSLATFFYLAALVFYVKARLRSSPLDYCVSLIFTVVGMFTKEIVFTLPFAIALYEFSFFRSSAPARSLSALGGKSTPGDQVHRFDSRLKCSGIMFLLLIFLTLFIIPWTMTRANDKTLEVIIHKNTRSNLNHEENLIKNALQITKAVSIDKMPYKEVILTRFNVLRTYLGLLLLPLDQNFDQDYPLSHSLKDPNTFLSFLLLLTLFILGLLMFAKHPLMSFGIFWFFLNVCVESIVVQGGIVFHRLYLPMVGFSLILVAVAYHIFRKNPLKLTAILLGLVCCYSILTYQRNFAWKDEFTLWDYTVHKFPHRPVPYNSRGAIYGEKGLLDQALMDFNKSIELDSNYAEAYSNRGSAYSNKGLLDQALADLSKAIELQPGNGKIYGNRGAVYQNKGLLDNAILDFNKSIELEPNFSVAYHNRGSVYEMKGLFDKALMDFNRAIELNPAFADTYYKRANLYFLRKEYDNGRRDAAKAQSLEKASSGNE